MKPVAILTGLALALSGCGSDADPPREAGGGGASADVCAEVAEMPVPSLEVGGRTKPEVELPDAPPDDLVVEDIEEGDGAVAEAGDTVEVHYVGVACSTGEQFDASWDSGRPITFPLGMGRVIPGWDEGVAGMREGGRRRLVIPSNLAYGPEGIRGVIGPDEALVFVVDLVTVQKAESPGDRAGDGASATTTSAP